MARGQRGKGEGSVYRRGDGRWVAQVEAGRTPAGRRRYSRAVRRTKAEALAALKTLHHDLDTGVVPDRVATVATFLDWWADTVLPGTVAATTEEHYRRAIRRWIVPYIGRVRLSKLTAGDVETMIRRLREAGMSPATQRMARTTLVAALGWAERTGLVARNVARLARGPKLGPRADDALTAAEAAQVLDAATCDRWEAIAVLAIRLGLRQGEILALRWEDVDLDAGTLTVRQAKTRAGERTVPLVAGTLDALRAHRARQDAAKAEAPFWADPALVFATSHGTRFDQRNLRVWWKDLLNQAGVEYRRFHATRHTAASMLLDADVPLEVVSAILGHSGLAITSDVYAKVSQDAKRRALSTLDV
ncbi:MAG: tyrosine-type recombinase/integrase [Acidimicrobiales bacterium]